MTQLELSCGAGKGLGPTFRACGEIEDSYRESIVCQLDWSCSGDSDASFDSATGDLRGSGATSAGEGESFRGLFVGDFEPSPLNFGE